MKLHNLDEFEKDILLTLIGMVTLLTHFDIKPILGGMISHKIRKAGNLQSTSSIFPKNFDVGTLLRHIILHL